MSMCSALVTVTGKEMWFRRIKKMRSVYLFKSKDRIKANYFLIVTQSLLQTLLLEDEQVAHSIDRGNWNRQIHLPMPSLKSKQLYWSGWYSAASVRQMQLQPNWSWSAQSVFGYNVQQLRNKNSGAFSFTVLTELDASINISFIVTRMQASHYLQGEKWRRCVPCAE